MLDFLVVVCRLTAAVVVGGLIGLNRDLNKKPSGVRTHAVVTLSAAIAILAALQTDPDNSRQIDAISRVTQGILTGIGFVGAGVILRDPQGHVTGLTTAASVWVSAGLGILCGLGYWTLIATSTAMVLGVLVFGGRVEKSVERWLAASGVDSDERQN